MGFPIFSGMIPCTWGGFPILSGMIPYIFTYQNWPCFGYEKHNGWYSEQPPEPPAHMLRERFHERMDVKIVLMLIVAENIGSVIYYIISYKVCFWRTSGPK